MRLKHFIPVLIALLLGGGAATLVSIFIVSSIEARSQRDVARILDLNGDHWVTVDVDGLQVILSGQADDEAARFHVMRTAASVVDASRVRDLMDVLDRAAILPPKFSIEILRSDAGISLIGLVPAGMDRDVFMAAVREIGEQAPVTDFLEAADFPSPDGWDNALSYALSALADLKRSKISIASDHIEIRAISESIAQKRKFEADLARRAPKGLRLAINITAPRQVITPFTLRFLIDADGPRFDACSTNTEAGRALIVAAAADIGFQGKADCRIGLGVPSPQWDSAVVIAINKLAEIGRGSITFSDADVTLVAADTTPQATFDQAVGELESTLPDAFSLHAILPEAVKIDGTGAGSGPPEFVATRSPEGQIQLRGRIASERTRIVTESFARAHFGSALVNGAMRLDAELPVGWSTRVLASLEALALLNHGSVVMQPDFVEIRGTTGDPDARAEISRLLSEKLGEAENFRIEVAYEAKLDPVLNLPTAKECVSQINMALAERKITFAPSSPDIDGDARETVAKIAAIMKDCGDFAMEIGGHTDSQGRESMNLTLSQSRANAVLDALLARRVLTSNLTAKGYGEAVPIDDNDTEEGRELNRRIEFTLIVADEDPIDTAAPDVETAAPGESAAETESQIESQTESTDEQN